MLEKTIANDKLMQYTIEIEKSKMKRTQVCIMSTQLILYPQYYQGFSSTATPGVPP